MKFNIKKIITYSIIAILNIVVHATILLSIMGIFVMVDYNNKNNKNGIYVLDNFRLFSYNSKNDTLNRLLMLRPFDIFTGNAHVQSNKKWNIQISNPLFCLEKDYQYKLPNISFGSCKSTVLFETKEEEQVFVVPKTGTYKIELWGAEGGYSYALGNRYKRAGKGAYTKGEIKLKKGEVLYFQVGSKGEDSKIVEDDERLTVFYYPSTGGDGGYNGGGTGSDDPQTDAGGGGGGATDVRLVSGSWGDFDSLKSRIMVAAGGGGMSRHYESDVSVLKNRGDGGSGGTTSGINSPSLIEVNKENGYGATQTTGYKFGIGEDGRYCKTSQNGSGGGAGGYFGSKAGACGIGIFEMLTGPGGGSSFVSGCKGCNAIEKNSTYDNLKFTNQSVHYSNKKFNNIVMKSGDEAMPSPYGGKMTGNKGNGHAKITFIKK